MEPDFWHRRWEKNEIAFHESKVNPLLTACFDQLALPEGSCIFLPLCGKTLDISWLLAKGYRVAGAELSKMAIAQLFADLGIKPTITKAGKAEHYRAPDIDIFVGDIFDLSAAMLGHINAVYDRAALVALPRKMRDRYAAHLMNITHKAPQLLICYDYDQSLMEGPPFLPPSGC